MKQIPTSTLAAKMAQDARNGHFLPTGQLWCTVHIIGNEYLALSMSDNGSYRTLSDFGVVAAVRSTADCIHRQ